MLVKLTEVNKIGTTRVGYSGKATFLDEKLETRELLINTDHIISINEDLEMTRIFKQTVSRLETTRGSFSIAGSPSDIQASLTEDKTKKVLRD